MECKYPKVSIIIPVYNVEDYLEKCLESVLNQTVTEIEIITINDGSTDGSLDILNKYAKLDSRIKIIDQKNKGLSGARNSGIKVAKGDYIVFVDSDDTIEKETLEELLSFATKNDLDIVVYGYTKLYENGEIIAKPNFGNKIIDNDEARRMSLSLKLSPMACNKFYKRELFIETKVKFPIGFLHEDIGTTYKLFWNAFKVGITSKSYYNWMVRGSSITGSFTRKHIEDIVFLLDEKKKFLFEIDQFENYKAEYLRAFFQIKTLLLERAIQSSTADNNILDYLLEKFKVHNSVSEENKILFKEYDLALYKKYCIFFDNAQAINNDLLHKKLQEYKENNTKAKDTNVTFIETKTSCFELLKQCIFPFGSKRRSVVVKIKNLLKGED